jgi:hypothetical protein
MKNKIAPLMILAYLQVPMTDDNTLLEYYPDIHKYCYNYINNNINSLIKYRKPIYFFYKKEEINYPITKYYQFK